MTRIKHHFVTLYSWVTNPVPGRTHLVEPVRSGDPSIKYPQGGLTVLCGRRFAREALAEAARVAGANGDRFVPVEIRVLAWRPVTSPHWFSSWNGKNVVDIHRLNAASEKVVAELWKRYLSDDGYHQLDIRALMAKKDFVSQMPHYIDRLRLEDPFVGIDVFLWRTLENGRRVARATLYGMQSVQSLRPITTESIEVVFPALGPSHAAPKNPAPSALTHSMI